MKQHQWFLHKLPAYLTLPPQILQVQERNIDEEIVAKGQPVTNMLFQKLPKMMIIMIVMMMMMIIIFHVSQRLSTSNSNPRELSSLLPPSVVQCASWP